MEYFKWLCNRIDCKTNYTKLMTKLYETEFTYIIENDENRYYDGLYLKNYYPDVDEVDRDWCSILEMLIALSYKLESIADDDDHGDRSKIWFWIMIDSLGLSDQTNRNYDEDFVDEVLYIFMNRKYSKDGKGGLFTVPTTRKDLRKIEIWYQACLYFNELLI